MSNIGGFSSSLVRGGRSGFTLPVVLIASTIMLIVLAAASAVVSSTVSSMNNQYYNQLATLAAESGLAAARECVENEGVAAWSTASLLRPNTDCGGGALCSADNCFVMREGNVRTRYEVAEVVESGSQYIMTATGIAEFTRASSDQVVRSYSVTKKTQLEAGQPAQWRQVSVGSLHACAISSSYQAYCWGMGTNGRLGNGTANQAEPTAVSQGAIPGGVTLTQVSAGNTHTCALASDNWVYCWGAATNGRLGNGATTPVQSSPVAIERGEIPATATISAVSVGMNHTCVLASDNWVYCWGIGTNGRLGNNSTILNNSTPLAAHQGELPAGATFTQVSAGNTHTCAIASNNQAYCWGAGTNGRLGNGTTQRATPFSVSAGELPAGATFTQISAGNAHTCALASNHQAYCWGAGTNGRLGNGGVAQQTSPVAVSSGAVPAGVTFTQINAGMTYSCGATATHGVYCWGSGLNGYLGNNVTSGNFDTPVAVLAGEVPTGSALNTVATSHNGAACGLANNHQMYCWGTVNQPTGSVRTTPVLIASASTPMGQLLSDKVSTGTGHTCALASNFQAYCWGLGTGGRLGDNSAVQRLSPVAVDTAALDGLTVRDVQAGNTHTCALASDDWVYCWGSAAGGRLGNGQTTPNRTTPVPIERGAIPNGITIQALSVGTNHTCVIGSNHQAYCWGAGANGQLGNNTVMTANTPVAVLQGSLPAGATFTQISAGNAHTCAIASNNQAYCWGAGSNGRLGSGTATRLTPFLVSQGAVPAGATFTQISAGTNHTCAIASNHRAYCWGLQTNGRLGNGMTAAGNVTTPAVVRGAILSPVWRDVTEVHAGNSHTCAIASDNQTYCWGQGANGRLGNADDLFNDSAFPVSVAQGAQSAGATARSLGLGSIASHTCIIGSNHRAYCWGTGTNGQLGQGSTANAIAPVIVDPYPL